jgi:hypothetical protein
MSYARSPRAEFSRTVGIKWPIRGLYHAVQAKPSALRAKAANPTKVGAAVAAEFPRMNTLTPEQQERILKLLRDGHSLREIERMTGHRRETISLYGRLAGIRREGRSGGSMALAA